MHRKAQCIEELVNLCRIFPQKHYKKKGNPQRTYLLYSYNDRAQKDREIERVLVTRGFCQLGTWLILGTTRTLHPRTAPASHSHTYVDSLPSFPPPMPKKKKLINSQISSLKNKNLIQRSLALSFDWNFILPSNWNPFSLSLSLFLAHNGCKNDPLLMHPREDSRAIQNMWAYQVEPSQVECATWIYWIIIHWACKITFVTNSVKGVIVAWPLALVCLWPLNPKPYELILPYPTNFIFQN